WPAGVEVADLGYGALLVVQDLEDAQPPYDRIVFLSAMSRGRTPGRLYRRRWTGVRPDGDEVQARIREAGAGVIDVDHLLVIAEHFRVLPRDVVVIELEPADTAAGPAMSASATALLSEMRDMVRAEARAPRRALEAADRSRP